MTPYDNLSEFILKKPSKYLNLKSQSVKHLEDLEQYFNAWARFNTLNMSEKSISTISSYEPTETDLNDEGISNDRREEMIIQQKVVNAEDSKGLL